MSSTVFADSAGLLGLWAGDDKIVEVNSLLLKLSVEGQVQRTRVEKRSFFIKII